MGPDNVFLFAPPFSSVASLGSSAFSVRRKQRPFRIHSPFVAERLSHFLVCLSLFLSEILSLFCRCVSFRHSAILLFLCWVLIAFVCLRTLSLPLRALCIIFLLLRIRLPRFSLAFPRSQSTNGLESSVSNVFSFHLCFSIRMCLFHFAVFHTKQPFITLPILCFCSGRPESSHGAIVFFISRTQAAAAAAPATGDGPSEKFARQDGRAPQQRKKEKKKCKFYWTNESDTLISWISGNETEKTTSCRLFFSSARPFSIVSFSRSFVFSAALRPRSDRVRIAQTNKIYFQ